MQISECIQLAPDKSGPREWIFTFNHAAMIKLEELSGQPAWALLVQEQETFTRMLHLAWAGSESFRISTRQQNLSMQEFRDAYLPEYLSDEWHVFQDAINDLVNRTFPKAGGTRTQLQTLTATMIMSNLANTAQLIGTSGSIAQSDGLECQSASSFMSGTG